MRTRSLVTVGGSVLVALVASAVVVEVRSMSVVRAGAPPTASAAAGTAGTPAATAGTSTTAVTPSDAGTASGLTGRQWADQQP